MGGEKDGEKSQAEAVGGKNETNKRLLPPPQPQSYTTLVSLSLNGTTCLSPRDRPNTEMLFQFIFWCTSHFRRLVRLETQSITTPFFH